MRTKFLKGAALDEGVFFCRGGGEAFRMFLSGASHDEKVFKMRCGKKKIHVNCNRPS
jgi:hypothetical protein